MASQARRKEGKGERISFVDGQKAHRSTDVSSTSKSYIDRAADHLTTQLLDYLKIQVESSEHDGDSKNTATPAGTTPEREGMLQDTPIYKSLLQTIKWQRDNYLVGRELADQRRKERRLQEEIDAGGVQVLPSLRFDEAALGNSQLQNVGSWYITSSSLYGVALPFVLTLPLGPLYDPALRASVDLIPMGQQPLDNVTKQSLMDVLSNDNMKGFVKNSYISRIYRDSPN